MTDKQFVILADESANWKIAGLRQLDRLVLALNELAPPAEKISVAVRWLPDISPSRQWLPNESHCPALRLSNSNAASGRILTTHLFVQRNALASFLPTTTAVVARSQSARELADEFKTACSGTNDAWMYVEQPNDIAAAEASFLRRTGKPQDGMVSRWINRPLTRPLTRLLLRLPITPTGWTLSIFALPILACVFLLRGDYASFIIGTAIYQLYSMLDGCDGEIARAKFLETKRGGRVDDLCDVAGALLFVIALGIGLSRTAGSWFYGVEGIALASLIALNEWALRIPDAPSKEAPDDAPSAAYPRHRRLIERAGLSRLGGKLLPFILQATKRDVGIVLFLLLALAGVPQWILHPWLAVTMATLSLNAFSYRKARA